MPLEVLDLLALLGEADPLQPWAFDVLTLGYHTVAELQAARPTL